MGTELSPPWWLLLADLEYFKSKFSTSHPFSFMLVLRGGQSPWQSLPFSNRAGKPGREQQLQGGGSLEQGGRGATSHFSVCRHPV